MEEKHSRQPEAGDTQVSHPRWKFRLARAKEQPQPGCWFPECSGDKLQDRRRVARWPLSESHSDPEHLGPYGAEPKPYTILLSKVSAATGDELSWKVTPVLLLPSFVPSPDILSPSDNVS